MSSIKIKNLLRLFIYDGIVSLEKFTVEVFK